MRQSYFIYNNNKYDSGELISFNFFDNIAGRQYNTQVKFLYYDTETSRYHIEVYGREYSYTEDLFYRNMLSAHITNTANLNKDNVRHTFSDELNIDSLLMAWIWYVFVMGIGIIFHDRIGIWIFASFVFFNYRNTKLKEAGYK